MKVRVLMGIQMTHYNNFLLKPYNFPYMVKHGQDAIICLANVYIMSSTIMRMRVIFFL